MVHKAHLVKSNSRHRVRNTVVAVKTIRGKKLFYPNFTRIPITPRILLYNIHYAFSQNA